MANIYEPKGRAREYSPLALNYIKGCDHGCLYCYVPTMMKRFNSEYVHKNVYSIVDYDSIRKTAKRNEGINKQILLSFTTDPYSKQIINQTHEVLNILNEYNHKVAILSKGGKRILRDMDIFKKFGNRIKIGASLTFDNKRDSKKWEYGAALPDDRIETLKILFENNIKTWVSFEPTIIPEQTLNLISKISGFVDHIKIGKVNGYNNIDKKIDWTKFLDDAVNLCRKLNIRFYIKEDLRKFNNGTVLFPNEIDMDHFNL